MIQYVLMFLSGLCIGMALGMIYKELTKDKPIGNLRIDQSDPDGPYMFLELQEAGAIYTKQEVTFRVKLEDYPQK